MRIDAPIALDRASVRRIDQDGHLFIEVANISAACVSPYNCEEIPNWEGLGLKPGQIYSLYRDADALAASAQSFAGKPLLFKHKPVSSEDHPHDIVVGAIGNDVRFEEPYLKASLSIWSKEAIDAIESGVQSDLSCGYYYECVMEPGEYKGTAFQGKMISIKGNHCALVTEGRVPGAYVGDSAIPLETIPETLPAGGPELIPETIPAPTPEATQEPTSPPEVVLASPYKTMKEILMPKANVALSRQAVFAGGAIRAYLIPKMAADQKIDLTPIIKPITAKNWKTQKPKIKVALDAALKGKLAADADLSDVIDFLDQLEDMPDEEVEQAAAAVDADPDADEDDDTEEEKKKKAKEAAEKLKEAAAEDEDKDDEDDDDKKKPAFLKDKKGARDKAAKDKAAMDAIPMVSVAAMDAALAAMKKSTETSTIARLRAIQEAEKAVRPYIGELAMASDSAEDIYRLALDHAGIDLDGVPPAAFPAMVKMLPKPGEVAPVKVARMAADASTLADAKTRFPGLAALKQR